jgi:hypothetical protein
MVPTRIKRRRMLFAPVFAALLVAALSAPTALAAPKTATATLTPSPVPAGTTASYSFTLAPDNGSIGSFTLTAGSGWTIQPLVSPPAGVTRPSATLIQGTGVSIGASSPLTVIFTAQAPCGTTNPAWPVVAKSSSNLTGSSFTVNALSTPLSGTCTAAFVNGRSPADAAFNGGSKSQNITSVPYTPTGPTATPMQVLVKDAGGTARPNVSITLSLRCTPTDSVCKPATDGASISGPTTATSDANGIATFTGSTSTPISIDRVGLRYRLEPTGLGVTGTSSGEFGIYEEGEACGASCSVHGKSGDSKIDATVTVDTPSGTDLLSVLVSDLGLDCSGSIPAGSGYVYTPLSAQVVAWKYTGTSSQTIAVVVDKTLVHQQTDRGNDLDFCFLVEGTIPGTTTPKSFVDKFGVTRTETSGPGLLPVCSPTIVRNCIVSETAAQGGDRLVTVTVDDGRGKI